MHTHNRYTATFFRRARINRRRKRYSSILPLTLNSRRLTLILFADITFRAHPIHLHGYRFAIMTQGRILMNESLTEEIVDRETQSLINNDTDPPLKDNIAVPNHGYAVVRFLADNPG